MSKFGPTAAGSNPTNTGGGSGDEYQDNESDGDEETDDNMHDGTAGVNNFKHEEDIQARGELYMCTAYCMNVNQQNGCKSVTNKPNKYPRA